MRKKVFTAADLRTKFITPALVSPRGAGWAPMIQVIEVQRFTKGRVIVRGKAVSRAEARKTDCTLHSPNLVRGQPLSPFLP